MAEQFTIPFAHRPDMSAAALIPHPGLAAAQEWLAAYPDWPTPALILHGPAAIGKSHLAASFTDQDFAGDILDLSPKALTQETAESLFHRLNHLRAVGGHMLILSRTPGALIYPALPDLDSRLRASSQVALEEPKDETVRQAILFKLCTDHQLRIDMETAAYICTRLPQTVFALDAFCHMAAQQYQRQALTKPSARPLIEKIEMMGQE